MNSENSKTSKSHILKLKLTDKLDLRLDKKVVAISNLSIYYTWKNIKDTYNNNKFKISAPTWNEEFKLPGWILFCIRHSGLFRIYYEGTRGRYRRAISNNICK